MNTNPDDIMTNSNTTPGGPFAQRTPRAIFPLSLWILAAALSGIIGCGSAKVGKKKEDFFTSGSREADQRANQRMAKAEQLSGSGEGSGEKGVKKAVSGTE